MADLLATWTRGTHTADGLTHDLYRKGGNDAAPAVIVIHELPGITPKVIAFAEEVVARGYTVVLPHLFGTPQAPATPRELATSFARVCVNREFTKLALGETTPVAGWLRSVARELHAELGGPGVGALGMCFTGGYALAMMVDAPVVAPVVCQPSTPFPFGKARAASLGLSDRDLEVVKQRAAAGCAVLGLRYRRDAATGSRFDTLRTELGDNFLCVEFDGRGHSVVTEQRQQQAVDTILDFFDERLAGRPG
ncbi:MAG TPA: dienelactone hydrolase family protein [Nocardioidaceae bacterium]|nr:dienelactone hydrolase family protein [Nocardioidaceae bacterium]